MISEKDRAARTAELLMQIKAIKLDPNHPFQWASGWISPIYCDNRRILSFPAVRNYVRQEIVRIINDEMGSVDLIAGVATGGIAIGALVAQELGLPFAYIRAEAKGHGMGRRIEGVAESGQSVIVIEDLISTGKSSLAAVEALREEGCRIKGMVAIFSYGFEEAINKFEESKVSLYTLTDYETLIQYASENGYIRATDLELLAQWSKNPAGWSK
jgi:orotate phosphoribosyltransferase